MAIAALVGLALLVLTAGVFAAATTSRQLAERSNRVHHLDSVVGSTNLIRAQLGFGLVLADVDQFAAIDSSAAVATTETDIQRTMQSLAVSRGRLVREYGGLDSETAAALDRYVAAVNALVPIDAREPLTEAETADLVARYESAETLLLAERDVALESVQESDERLSRISTLISFLAAFVIPTLAVVLYRLLSAPQREVLVAEARSARDRTVAELRRSVVVTRLEALQRLAAEESPALARQVDEVRRTLLSLEFQQRCVFAEVAVSSSLDRAMAAVSAQLAVTVHGEEAAAVWSDTDLFDLVLRSLLSDACHRGARQADVMVAAADDRVTIEFRHDGAPRSPSECDVISGQATIVDRMSLLGGPDVDLVAALHLAGDLQGDVVLGPDDAGRQRLLLSLPAVAPIAAPRIGASAERPLLSAR